MKKHGMRPAAALFAAALLLTGTLVSCDTASETPSSSETLSSSDNSSTPEVHQTTVSLHTEEESLSFSIETIRESEVFNEETDLYLDSLPSMTEENGEWYRKYLTVAVNVLPLEQAFGEQTPLAGLDYDPQGLFCLAYHSATGSLPDKTEYSAEAVEELIWKHLGIEPRDFRQKAGDLYHAEQNIYTFPQGGYDGLGKHVRVYGSRQTGDVLELDVKAYSEEEGRYRLTNDFTITLRLGEDGTARYAANEPRSLQKPLYTVGEYNIYALNTQGETIEVRYAKPDGSCRKLIFTGGTLYEEMFLEGRLVLPTEKGVWIYDFASEECTTIEEVSTPVDAIQGPHRLLAMDISPDGSFAALLHTRDYAAGEAPEAMIVSFYGTDTWAAGEFHSTYTAAGIDGPVTPGFGFVQTETGGLVLAVAQSPQPGVTGDANNGEWVYDCISGKILYPLLSNFETSAYQMGYTQLILQQCLDAGYSEEDILYPQQEILLDTTYAGKTLYLAADPTGNMGEERRICVREGEIVRVLPITGTASQTISFTEEEGVSILTDAGGKVYAANNMEEASFSFEPRLIRCRLLTPAYSYSTQTMLGLSYPITQTGERVETGGYYILADVLENGIIQNTYTTDIPLWVWDDTVISPYKTYVRENMIGIVLASESGEKYYILHREEDGVRTEEFDIRTFMTYFPQYYTFYEQQQ